jgi:hypothetical protein
MNKRRVPISMMFVLFLLIAAPASAKTKERNRRKFARVLMRRCAGFIRCGLPLKPPLKRRPDMQPSAISA